MKLSPHLNFNGDCVQALAFYQSVLGAKVLVTVRYSEMGMADSIAPGMADKIAHCRFAIGDMVIMAADVPAERYGKAEGFDLVISLPTPEEAEATFKALLESGTIQMPMAETSWALRFGMGEDRFGIPWMVSCEKAMGS